MTRLAQIFGILLVAACAHSGESAVPIEKTSLEKGWESLAKGSDRAHIDEAIRHFENAVGEELNEPAALSGLTAALGLAGYLSQDGRDRFRAARERGLECLLSDPGFQARLRRADGVLTSVVMDRVDMQRWDCLYWTTWAWTRWIYTRGTVAMELDHAVVQDMATRVRALAPEERMAEAIGLHGLALSLSIDRRGAAEESLKLAIDHRPEDWTLVVDLAEYVLFPSGREAEARDWLSQLHGRDPKEARGCCIATNKKAVDRMEQLLSRLYESADGQRPKGDPP